jgi:hypothetical protein
VFQYQSQLDQYVTWMRNERGFSIAETDDPQDIRDRAILLLLAVYGMRSGEEAALRLDQIDWPGYGFSACCRRLSGQAAVTGGAFRVR